MSDQLGYTLAWIHVPNVGSAVKTARDYLVAEGVVESEGLNHIFVAEEGVEFSAVLSILQFTSSVLWTSNESSTIFIKTNIW